MTLTSPHKKNIKRKRNIENWRRYMLKRAINCGEKYETHSSEKKIRNERKMKPTSTDKCKMQRATKFTEDQRQKLFTDYWKLGDIEKQRQLISNSMVSVELKYRYIRIGGTRNQRGLNNAFHFYLDGKKVRVCKLFFKNTLDINDRPIRTVISKQNKIADVLLEEDRRGKHGQQKKVSKGIRDDIEQFIESIPKIESNYTRANTSKHFIESSKTVTDLHRDYDQECKLNHTPYGNSFLIISISLKTYI